MALRETLERLRAHPEVVDVRLERCFATGVFKIRFKDGIKEHWFLSDDIHQDHNFSHIIPPGMPLFTGRPVPTYREFEANPLEADYESLQSYFVAPTRDFARAGFCEQRLKVHELISELLKEGWVDFKYPERALRHDFEAVKSANLKNYWEASHRLTIYKLTGKVQPGRIMLSHFNPIGTMKYRERPTLVESWCPISLCQAINYNLAVKKDVTRNSIVRILTADIPDGTRIAGPRLPNVIIWRAIFDKLKLTSVRDLAPNCGEKAIAAAACGMGYTADNLPVGLAEFLGTKPATNPTTIITGTNPIDDATLKQRLDGLKGEIIAIITKDQLSQFSPMQQYEIRTEPHSQGKILHTLIYMKI